MNVQVQVHEGACAAAPAEAVQLAKLTCQESSPVQELLPGRPALPA